MVLYTMEYYEAERKKELRPFTTTCMELESIMLSEVSQVVKDKCLMKGYSASLAIREMQIKTTIRYHFTQVRTAIINKSTTTSAGKVVEEREP